MEAAQDIDRAATELTTGTADEGNPACSETPAPKAACEGTSRSDGAGPQHDVEDVGESSDERREAKGAGEGAKAAAEEEHANSGDGREEGDRPTKKFSPEASLYCQVNGRSHAILLDFDYDDCPLCQQDLMSPENPDFQPAKLSGGKPDPKTSVVPDVSYLVEYRNRRNEFIHQEPWEGAFDLSTARKDVEQSDTSVFRLVTVLSTSIQPEVWHMPENKLNKSKSILKTPNIAISVYTTRLTIHSLSLIQLLRRFVPYYPSVNLNSGVLELEEPFALIGHYYEELEAYRTAHRNMRVADDQIAHGKGDDNEDTASVRHLGTLLDHFQKVMLRRIREEETLHGQNFCTFRMLWLLYKPGSTVYLGSGGRLSAFVVQSVTTDPAIMTTVAPDLPKPYVISVWNLAYDGRYVGRTGKTVAIAPFEGERKIASLRVIPCEFIDNEDGGQTRRGLEENGRRWYGLLPGGQAYYSGPLLNSTKRKDDEVAAADYAYNETLHGRVYVDPASFYTYEPDKAPERNEIHDFGENPVVQRLSRLGAPPPHPATLPASGPLAKCQCEECHGRRPHPPHGFPWTNYDILDPAVEKDLTLPGGRDGPLHRYLLCDRLLHGFDLKSRTWGKKPGKAAKKPLHFARRPHPSTNYY